MNPLTYPYSLPTLGYSFGALEPYISEWTMRVHYKQNHAAYVRKANKLMAQRPDLQHLPLPYLLSVVEGPLFNALAQHWNHTFYWKTLRPPSGKNKPTGPIAGIIDYHFGGMGYFTEELIEKGSALFGSGWIWVSLCQDGKVRMEVTEDADNPLVHGRVPILTQDLWEHAYHCDYGAHRADYLRAFPALIDWDQINERLYLLET